MKTTLLVLLTVLGTLSVSALQQTRLFVITTLSSRADLVSGGTALIRLNLASRNERFRAELNGRDVTTAFKIENADGSRETLAGAATYLGLVTGLVEGPNMLRVSMEHVTPDQTLRLTNYPITGPMISGPHQTPFVCQTETFKLPDGSTLGPPTDANCSAPTRVQYVYLPRGAKEFKPLSDPSVVPADVAPTTTLPIPIFSVGWGAGVTGREEPKIVPFIVRVETGTMNRGIYQNLVLHDPTRDPAPTPFTPPPAWNRRLIAIHGVGCPSGWYRQGGVMGVNPLTGTQLTRLGEGYAIFTNTLNHPTNSCNAFLAGETAMMGKEHVIKEFGVPEFTVSMGSSGGAYTSLQIADEFPGLFDGILINATFPDALSIAWAGADAHLLARYLQTIDATALTPAQVIAVSGYQGMKAFIDAANQSQRTDPIAGRDDIEGYKPAVWNAAMPDALKYDVAGNPRGARPTVFDAAINIYGADPKTGFALRPFDNAGVQYGLAALKAGIITPAQFLDLNEKIGGFDQDANPVASRSIGDAGAIQRAYQGGATLGGGGGLASIPVFDDGAYNDERGYHYQWFHFAVRERMAKQNGGADNHVMWRGPVQSEAAWAAFITWVAASKGPRPAAKTARQMVIETKPSEVVDGCWIVDADEHATFVAEPQTFSSKPDSKCNTAYPSSGFTRYAAGGPIDANVLKCQLVPIDASDYASFTPQELQRLRTVFPDGVCDYSKPGLNQTRVVPWASFGPAPENLIFDIRQHKPSN
jgi:hypothetical protein